MAICHALTRCLFTIPDNFFFTKLFIARLTLGAAFTFGQFVTIVTSIFAPRRASMLVGTAFYWIANKSLL
mgnify:CR=1 FL=1